MKNPPKSFSLTVFDFMVNVVWRVFRVSGQLVVVIGSGIANIIARLWSATGHLPYCERVCAETSGFFRGIGRGIRIVLYPFSAIGCRIVAKADQSLPARRLAVVVLSLGIVIVYWLVTPCWPYGAWYASENGKASWYGGEFYFRRTASGEWFLPGPFYTAAHKTLPLGTKVLVVNTHNQDRVVVRISDRGPFVEGRIIDLTYAAAKKIGLYQPGTADVVIYTRQPRYQHARRIFVVPFRRAI